MNELTQKNPLPVAKQLPYQKNNLKNQLPNKDLPSNRQNDTEIFARSSFRTGIVFAGNGGAGDAMPEQEIKMSSHSHPHPHIRYAVVGIGKIAQEAVLPAFENARENSVLAAFVSGHPAKARKASKQTKAPKKEHPVPIYRYEEYDSLLDSGAIDAVYLSVPNHLHYEYAKKALERGIHVLCEKPFVLEEAQAQELVRLARKTDTRLMVAYRLHFDPANLRAIEIAQSGKLGPLKYFNSSFSFRMEDQSNIRLQKKTGGGPIWDIGVYCINAARNLFREEPTEVFAFTATHDTETFDQVPESIAVSLRFPKGRIASFVCSFGTEAIDEFELAGEAGKIRLQDAYDYRGTRTLTTTINGKESREKFKQEDQFAPELIYFSDCIMTRTDPEPSGLEGWADVKVIRAALQSAKEGKSVKLGRQSRTPHKMQKPKVKPPALHEVNASHRSVH